MNPKIKAKWIAALRSGKYQQGQHRLRKTTLNGETQFCCLGVLCNLHAKAHPKIAQHETDPEIYLGENQWLPRAVREWAGLSSREGGVLFFAGISDPVSLADANDGNTRESRRCTFAEIANAIESQL